MDTFCFDPDTPIFVKGKGLIPISDVEMEDELEGGSVVTSLFRFYADGQPMVTLGNTLVSTNHFVQNGSTWVKAGEHPDAKPARPWSGGTERPLICLNTNDHNIIIGDHVFLDYDETEDCDSTTMKWVEDIVNGNITSVEADISYSNIVFDGTLIKMKDGSLKTIGSIVLDEQTLTGKVIGTVKKQVYDICTTENGDIIGAGLLIWSKDTNKWQRAASLYPVRHLDFPLRFTSLILLSSAVLETEAGLCFRDYMEVHSPDAENLYEEHVRAKNCQNK